MPIDKEHIRKGQRMNGAAFAVELPQREPPQRGQFTIGGSRPGELVRKSVSPALADEFAEAIAEADRLAAQSLGEIEQRLADARRKLAELRAAVKR